MRILVIDVAAEYGGAVSVLDDYLHRFQNDGNEYILFLGRVQRDSSGNISVVNFPYVKKSYLHRLFFDTIHIKILVKRYAPDLIFSLQNKAVSVRRIPQEVFYHNMLPIWEKSYSFFESRTVWLYQHVIGRIYRCSLMKKQVQKVIVQAEWIKRTLFKKWGIPENRIEVNQPQIVFGLPFPREDIGRKTILFYPSSAAIYKNHKLLIEVLAEIFEEYGVDCGLELNLTLEKNQCPSFILARVQFYPIHFLGRLSRDEMIKNYCRSTLVFPSLLESVGLPLLEAKHFRSPILAADLQYAHEALGDYNLVHYFDPKSKEDLKKCLLDQLPVMGK